MPITLDRANSQPAPVRKPRRRGGFIFLAILLLLVVAAFYNLKRVIVHGRSMEPTFHTAQNVWVWTTVPRDSLKIGDVVVLAAKDGHDLIKRIVFIQNPAGTAPMPAGVWTPNGTKPFRELFGPYYDDHVNRSAPPVNDERILVMGDNYDESEDSRDFGPIAPSQIVGKVIR